VKVILSALAGARDMEECRLTRRERGHETTLILQVLATPLAQNGEAFTLLTVANLGQDAR
jgi:hypothetical protein